MIDIRATVNFMIPEFAKRAKIPLTELKKAYAVTAIDDKPLRYNNRLVNQKTEDVQLKIRPYQGIMRFNITLTEKYDVVLELLWLKDVDPTISY